jgi:phosphatidylethanolamine/phosphatidyl-N-methylethanolamine N-methyltransferase
MLAMMKDSPDSSRSQPVGWTFFRQWLKNPREVAAISPSSKQLARQMVHQLPRHCRRVIELGGGTGVLTRAVLAHGVKPEDLLVLELNEELHQHLHREFPGVHAVCGDAMHLGEIARSHGFVGDERADAIVSGLGLLNMPRISQQLILAAAFEAMQPEGRFVQFTYGPANPVSREVLDALELTSRRASFTWWNVPPATVYVYQRRVSRAMPPRSMR